MTTRRKQRQSDRREAGLPLKDNRLIGQTDGQREYLRVINTKKLIFCIGPAGAGKSHIAACQAILDLAAGKYDKVVITRPLVTISNERIGFLPGPLEKKTLPFLRPIYDEMENYLDIQEIRKLLNSDVIEICPLGMMRGRTFKNAFIVADEIQSATYEQLKSLLTRIGIGSKMVITGDPAQTDLLQDKAGGMEKMISILEDDPEVGVCRLTKADIVREPLVQRIVEKIEEHENGTGPQKSAMLKRRLPTYRDEYLEGGNKW